jgi:uncharacterized protein YndB with AHSA1/START domain
VITGFPEFGLTGRVRQLDPTRLIESTTGWYDHGAGDYSVRLSALAQCFVTDSGHRITTTTPTRNVVPRSTPSNLAHSTLFALDFKVSSVE